MADPIKERLQEISSEGRRRAKGFAGTPLQESLPKFISTQSEKVIEGANNSFIVFGRDRLGNRLSGYGGKGEKGAGSIDIVVGRHGNNPKVNYNEDSWVDPSPAYDSARVYLSQKSDIDEDLGLTKGKVGNPKGISTVAIISDNTRIIGRDGIKLVTRPYAKNSKKKQISEIKGIDLIAGNNDQDLQPIPLGNNLKEAIERILHHLDKLNGIVDGLLNFQMQMNEQLTHHFHYSPFFGLPTTPSPTVVQSGIQTMINHFSQTKRSILLNKVNINMAKSKFTNPTSPKYILSRYNNSN